VKKSEWAAVVVILRQDKRNSKTSFAFKADISSIPPAAPCRPGLCLSGWIASSMVVSQAWVEGNGKRDKVIHRECPRVQVIAQLGEFGG